MAVRYEWQERRGGRRYVRVVEPDKPVKVEPEPDPEPEPVAEVVIEDEPPKPKRGRPKAEPEAEMVAEDG